MNTSRRNFIGAAGLSALGRAFTGQGVQSLAMGLTGLGALAHHASADAAGDYRALVCLYMAGGNDSHNWLIPVDSANYADYARARTSLAVPLANLLPLSSATRQAAGRRFAMPLDLQPLQQLYENGKLAITANVGPLVQPITKREFLAGTGVPPKLFSHNDQTANWQSLGPEGTISGWGGRMADALQAMNGRPVLTCVSAAGNALFLSGASAVQYQLSATGAVPINALAKAGTFGSASMQQVLARTQQDAGANGFQNAYAGVTRRSMDNAEALRQALAAVPAPALPSQLVQLSNGGRINLAQSPLIQQLRMVAHLISAHQVLGMRRQVFLVSMPGFDTHGQQAQNEPTLMATVANAIAYFMAEIERQGRSANVTLFTASDFGRTLTTNGSGTDHGWGSHHFIAGPAAKGGDIYGRFPSLALGGNDEVGSGRLLPSTSVIQYAAPLGKWLGVPDSDLASALPGQERFTLPTMN